MSDAGSGIARLTMHAPSCGEDPHLPLFCAYSRSAKEAEVMFPYSEVSSTIKESISFC